MTRVWSLLVAVVLAVTLLPASSASAAPAASGDGVQWLCHPGMKDDPCEIGLDATYQHADGTATVSTLPRKKAKKRKFDCFYVYPTVSNQLTPTATKARDPEITSIANFQAARYSSVCRVYAPLYRQATFGGILTNAVLPSSEAGYADVLAAWKQYLKKDNHGRGVVLIGHSQGSLVLRRLIREQVDPRPKVRKRIAGVLLAGGNVMVKPGSTTGGDFQTIPTCSRLHQVGCVTAFSTYDTDPLPGSFFGSSTTDLASTSFRLPTGPQYQVACVDPAVVTGNHDPFGITVPSKPFAPGVINGGIAISTAGQYPTASTTWVSPPDRFQGTCRSINGANVFRYAVADSTSRAPLEFPPLWGTHLFDLNLGLDRLVQLVRVQGNGWVRKHR